MVWDNFSIVSGMMQTHIANKNPRVPTFLISWIYPYTKMLIMMNPSERYKTAEIALRPDFGISPTHPR
jgi:hypothetical protein